MNAGSDKQRTIVVVENAVVFPQAGPDSDAAASALHLRSRPRLF